MIVHITGLYKFGIKRTREFTCVKEKKERKKKVRTMSRCISSLVRKHFDQVARKPPFFLRFFLRTRLTRFKKVIFSPFLRLVSPCLASAGLHLFVASLRTFAPSLSNQLASPDTTPNTVDNIRLFFLR